MFEVRVLTVESVTIYHSERVETVFPGVCFHGDSVMHHMLSAASICSPLRRRRSLHETHGNLHLLKPAVSYRLFAPKMSVNSLGDSGKTRVMAYPEGKLYKPTDGYLGPKQLKVQRLMPRRMFIVPSKQKQVLLTLSFCPNNNNNRKTENPFEMMRGAQHYG